MIITGKNFLTSTTALWVYGSTPKKESITSKSLSAVIWKTNRLSANVYGFLLRTSHGMSMLMPWLLSRGTTIWIYYDILHFINLSGSAIRTHLGRRDGIITKAIIHYLMHLNWTVTRARFCIRSVRDRTRGIDTPRPDGRAVLHTTPSTQMLPFSLTNECIGTLRTSGTETNFKLRVKIAGKPQDCRSKLRQTLLELVDEIIDHMLQPTENGLQEPCRLDIS